MKKLQPHEQRLHDVLKDKIFNLTKVSHLMMPKKSEFAAVRTVQSRLYSGGRFHKVEIANLKEKIDEVQGALDLFLRQERTPSDIVNQRMREEAHRRREEALR